MRLTLLHFNDLHARLDQLPRLFTLIQSERARARNEGRAVLLFDCGDSSDPAIWESDVTLGRANYALLEAMGVDAGVIGNNEAGRWGRRGLEAIATSTHFPLLAANLVDSAHPEQVAVSGLKPSTLVELDGFALGLIGLTAVFPQIYAPFGYTSTDPLAALQCEIAHLQAQGARALVVLSHLGLPADTDLARECPAVAVILGGHTHTVLETPVRVGGVILAQAGEHGRYLGQLDLDLDPTSGRVQNFSGHLIPCAPDIPPDPTISATLEFVREEAARLR
jgi:2',3'-cyclic-nucleotide 2'-phosphodiesterase (5'-nucleotidase family)